MAAYAAVISLKHTINGLLNSSFVSLVPSTREYLEVAYDEATSMQQVLVRSNESSMSRSRRSHERVDGLEGQIRDFAHKLEDVLEFHEYSYSDDGDAEEVMRYEITSFGAAVKKMENDYIQELSRDDDADDEEVLSRIDDFGVNEMVGHSKLFTDYRDYLLRRMRPDELCFYALFGVNGSGRSLAVKSMFVDAREGRTQFFDCWAWVKVGAEPQVKEVLMSIISQVRNPDDDHQLLISMEEDDEEKLSAHLFKLLEDRRYMIVLDDIDDVELVNYLKSNSFPDESNGSIVFLTTNSKEVDDMADRHYAFKMDPSYFEALVWLFIRQVLFGIEYEVPQEMEVAAKKIIHNCRCQLIAASKTLMLLLETDETVEEWSRIAADQQHPIFMIADETSEINQIGMQLQSYDREFVEYMSTSLYGFFAASYASIASKMHPQRFFFECLSELVDRSIVMVQRNVLGSQIKTCRHHSVFWHLSNIQAGKNNFFHAMNTYDDCSMEKMESQRKVCVRNSILLGMEYVQKSMASNTGAHSLLCVGPFQQYPVPLNFELRLLRVVNAITIRLYEFPVEVVNLIHLKYLGLMCNGELPTSISKLWKLQYLVVKRYMSINSSSQKSSHLPIEIWDMKELKHLQVMGGCLPNRKCGSGGLLKLSTLLDVSAQGCRKKVLKGIPNLTRLGIRIELAPNDKGNPFRCLNRISRLRRLESLKCVVVNPQIRSEVVSPPAPISMFPPSLKKLSLNGLGYPWEYMSIIGKLENLEVLKLKCYAFEGPKWEMDHTSQFEKLKFLLVEDTNLVQWKLNLFIDMSLKHLCIKHCYKLQELPILLRQSLLENIEIVDCSPLTVTWAKETADRNISCEISVHDSWRANTTKNDS